MKGRAILIALFLSVTFCAGAGDRPDGNLIIIGGGSIPRSVMETFVTLAGGSDARIAVIPMASSEYRKAGRKYVRGFNDLGVTEAKAFYVFGPDDANKEEVSVELDRCTGFFFGGGDQRKLTRIFLHTKALETMHRKYREGAVVGGTSAGAAIMSEVMITGDGDWDVLIRGSVITKPGLGFVDTFITDQHFVTRSRLNRLISVCLASGLPGVGIDESTALWVKPAGEATVIGNSVVVVVDPHGAGAETANGQLWSARNLSLSVLRPGDNLDLTRLDGDR